MSFLTELFLFKCEEQFKFEMMVNLMQHFIFLFASGFRPQKAGQPKLEFGSVSGVRVGWSILELVQHVGHPNER